MNHSRYSLLGLRNDQFNLSDSIEDNSAVDFTYIIIFFPDQ